MLENIPKLILRDQNEETERLPTKEEVNNVVFSLNGDNASGSNGYYGHFFRSC